MRPTDLVKIDIVDFDLEMTLESGQVFHWEKIDHAFYGTIGDEPVYVEQRGSTLNVSRGRADLVHNYFALDHPLEEICASFPDDPIMNAARSYCRGLRIIRQPKWECLATFITSSMKQIAHIRQITSKLRERFGQPRKIGHYTVRIFPSASRLAGTSEKELRECALGYRAENLMRTAQLVNSGKVDLEDWSALSDIDLRGKLCALPGVGAKVANCVMLFAYERLRAFPIDVWIERVLKRKYFPRRKKMSASALRAFAETYFGAQGGYAQQYLFHHARMTSRNGGRRAVGAKKVARQRVSLQPAKFVRARRVR